MLCPADREIRFRDRVGIEDPQLVELLVRHAPCALGGEVVTFVRKLRCHHLESQCRDAGDPGALAGPQIGQERGVIQVLIDRGDDHTVGGAAAFLPAGALQRLLREDE